MTPIACAHEMAEVVRNVVVAVTAIVAAHIALLVWGEPNEGTSAAWSPARSIDRRRETFSGPINPSIVSNDMPMDGLPAMFEFARARDASRADCDRANLVPDAVVSEPLRRTIDPYPEQIGGQYAVVNAYEGEAVTNGGADGGTEYRDLGGGTIGGIAAFDGWDSTASAV